jgi:tRNA G10  N-methylase Trm11
MTQSILQEKYLQKNTHNTGHIQDNPQLILYFHQDNLTLAQYEAEQLLGKLTYLNSEKTYALLPQITVRSIELVKRLSYTRRYFITIPNLETIYLQKLASYKITFYPQEPSDEEKIKCFNELYAQLKLTSPNIKIQMKNPQCTFSFLNFDDSNKLAYLTTAHEIDDSYLARKAQLREKRHPSAMSAKLAKAMLNIAGDVESILDPFCGTGGLLIEGLHMNLTMYGSDIERKMVYGAKINLQNELAQLPDSLDEIRTKWQNTIQSLHVCDALTTMQQADAIVSDVPYGKNTANITHDLYFNFLIHAKELTQTVVICIPHFATVDFEGAGWVVEKQIPQYVHKSLTRIITHLRLK